MLLDPRAAVSDIPNLFSSYGPFIQSLALDSIPKGSLNTHEASVVTSAAPTLYTKAVEEINSLIYKFPQDLPLSKAESYAHNYMSDVSTNVVSWVSTMLPKIDSVLTSLQSVASVAVTATTLPTPTTTYKNPAIITEAIQSGRYKGWNENTRPRARHTKAY
jgi:hypothetical protein